MELSNEIKIEPELLATESVNHEAEGKRGSSFSIRKLDKLEKKVGRNYETLFARAAIYFNNKEFKRSRFYFEKAYEINKNTELIHCLLKVCKKLNILEEARKYFNKVPDVLEKNPVFWQLAGYVELDLENPSVAADKFLKARSLGFPDENLNLEFLSKSLNNANRMQEILELLGPEINAGNKNFIVFECYLSALLNFKDYAAVHKLLMERTENDWQNSGRINAYEAVCQYQLFHDHDKCYSFNKKAHELSPETVQIRWNLALASLRIGKIREGIGYYKDRFEWKEFPSPRRVFEVPIWNENICKEKKIMIWSEQGIGDELLFVNAISEFQKVFPNLIFETHPKTIETMERSFPDLENRIAIFNKPELTPIIKDYDYHIPLGDVFLWFIKNNLDKLEKNKCINSKPYVIPDKLRKEYWRLKLPNNGKPNVGFCWTSKNVEGERQRYHSSIESWKKLLERTDVNFISLQYNYDFDDLQNEIGNLAKNFVDTGFLDQMDDLDGAFSLISNLDLIITSPSAPYIMGPICGVETWYYGAPAPFMLGRTGKFIDHPIQANLKHYTTENASGDQELVNHFNKKLDEYTTKFNSTKNR